MHFGLTQNLAPKKDIASDITTNNDSGHIPTIAAHSKHVTHSPGPTDERSLFPASPHRPSSAI